MKKYYLAYGSNLNLEQMKYRCPNAKKVDAYLLKDWNLEFRYYLTIIKDKGYSYQINYPYTGSIIPNGLTKKELENVYSIMTEANKRIYL